VWRERFGYLDALRAFGIKSFAEDNTAIISKSAFRAAEADSPDLRGGMACLLSALAAEGQSKIHSAEIILRGYENLIEKFSALGANVNMKET
jgi:UDP-N-acetylglucosamine 1-carboxyvinyltransferase